MLLIVAFGGGRREKDGFRYSSKVSQNLPPRDHLEPILQQFIPCTGSGPIPATWRSPGAPTGESASDLVIRPSAHADAAARKSPSRLTSRSPTRWPPCSVRLFAFARPF